jgi:hypothetical protein
MMTTDLIPPQGFQNILNQLHIDILNRGLMDHSLVLAAPDDDAAVAVLLVRFLRLLRLLLAHPRPHGTMMSMILMMSLRRQNDERCRDGDPAWTLA